MLILFILLQDKRQVSYEVHNHVNLYLQSFYNLVLGVSLHIKLKTKFCHYNTQGYVWQIYSVLRCGIM